MWVARRNARLYTFAFADVFQPDIRRTPVCRHVILREEGGTTLGEGEKGEKRSEGKREKGKMNRTGRPWISNSSCRSCYLLSKGITCQRTQSRVQSIPVFRFTNGYQKLRRMNFYSKRWRERERERRFRRGNRASSYEIPFRESEKGSIKFASYFEFRLETETVIPLFERISYYIASS